MRIFIFFLFLISGFSSSSFAAWTWSNTTTSSYGCNPQPSVSALVSCEASKISCNGHGGGFGTASDVNIPAITASTTSVSYQWRAQCSDGFKTGQVGFNAGRGGTCPSPNITTSVGECVAPVQCNGGAVTPQNTCQCPAGYNLNNGTCELDQPCDSSDQASAQSKVSQNNSIGATKSLGTLNAGYNRIQESTTTATVCIDTCYVKTTLKIWLGAVIGNQYEIFDQTTQLFLGGGCSVDKGDSSTSTSWKDIGADSSGGNNGCKEGFSYGSVNGQIGCHYHGQTNSGGNGNTTSTSTSTTTTTGTDGGGNPYTETSTTTTTTTTPNGAGGNGTDGSGIGCDPTSADYFECTAPQGEEAEHTRGQADSFGEALENFTDGISQTGVGQLSNNLANIFPAGGGSCPAPGFDIFERHYVIDGHCALYSNISGMLSSIMIVVWTIIGLRIIVSA